MGDAMGPISTPTPSSSSPGILPFDAPPTQLRYWDGREWVGGPVASTWQRTWGYAVDAIAATVLLLISFVLFAIPISIGFPDPESTGANTGFSVALISAALVSYVGYFALCYRFWGRTLGMLLAGTHVVHVPSGAAKLPWGPALIRALVLSAGYICGLLWLIWLLITATSKTKQGPHDLAAKSGVLTSRPKVTSTPVATPISPPMGVAVQEPLRAPANQLDPKPEVNLSSPGASSPDSSPSPRTLAAHHAIPDKVTSTAGTEPASPKALATIFISHASEDGPVAQNLADALEAQGIATWLASRDVSIGANYAAEIFQSLVNSDYLLVVLSPSSIESAHVRREVSIAIDRKVPVLPVTTDPSGELMANLPEDWQYWLNIAQVFRMNDEESTAVEIARRVK